MIIIRYLVRETLKSQLAILFILLLIFFCQKLVRILGAAVDGDIPTNLVLSLLGLGIPEMAQLILPLSLFLGLLMTLGKLYTESEITVMHACGLSKAVLIKAAMILALITLGKYLETRSGGGGQRYVGGAVVVAPSGRGAGRS